MNLIGAPLQHIYVVCTFIPNKPQRASPNTYYAVAIIYWKILTRPHISATNHAVTVILEDMKISLTQLGDFVKKYQQHGVNLMWFLSNDEQCSIRCLYSTQAISDLLGSFLEM